MTSILQDDELGQSVTENPGEHIFQVKDTLITFIDTPGLKDTKNTVNQGRDKENVKSILRLLSAHDEIHAICILLKACESRLTESFKYTLTEILRRLDSDAINNVLFIFTHASSENFKPHTTQSLLQKFLIDNKLNIPLPPDRETIYCFENYAVKYLAQRKNEIPHNDDDEDDEFTEEIMSINWKRSVKSTKKMHDYICSLNPHSLANIKAIYSAEHQIGVLSELVLETLTCIFKHMDDLERKKKEAEELKEKITKNPAHFAQEDVRKLLYIEKPKAVWKHLGYTNVVCEGSDCAKVVNDEIVYPQICCKQCTRPWMITCDKMKLSGYCTVCKCELRKHTRTTAETKIISENVYQPDDSSIAKIVDSNAALKAIEKVKSECKDRQATSRSETDKMLSTCAKLSSLVHKDVLLANDDNDDELLEKLKNKIQTYEDVGLKDAENLKYLREIKCQYEQFMTAERKKKGSYDAHELMQQLYELPTNGENLKEAMKAEENARKTAVKLGKQSGRVWRLGSQLYT